MRDVATASGVAVKTVSRVMNGERYVRPETVERVRAAASSLGYVLHEQAAELRRRNGGSRALGLLASSVSNHSTARCKAPWSEWCGPTG